MKVAVFGEQNLKIRRLDVYLPPGVTELISAETGTVGDCVAAYALAHNLPMRSFPLEYQKYGQSAFIRRFVEIIDYADYVVYLLGSGSFGASPVLAICSALDKPIGADFCPKHSTICPLELEDWS